MGRVSRIVSALLSAMWLLHNSVGYPKFCDTSPSGAGGGPQLPSVSNQFTVHVEAVLLEKNVTMEFVEYYDYDNNRGRLSQMQEGNVTDFYYNYATSEMFVVRPDTYECRVLPLISAPYTPLLGYTPSGHIFSPSAALRFGQAGTVQTYIGKSVVRGITVNQWTSCLEWPDHNATFTLTWSFLDSLWSGSADVPSVPVECHVTGRVYSNETAYRNFEHYYSFLAFRETVPPDSEGVFQTPSGVVCPGRRNTKDLPPVPDAMTFTGEIINEERKCITYTTEQYDMLGRVVAFTLRGCSAFSVKYGMNPLTVIHDFNTGTQYVIDLMQGNCTVSTLTPYLDVGHSDPVTLRIKSAQELMELEGNYTYEGMRMIRDVPCDVWIARKPTMDTQGTSVNATYEWAFLITDGWSTEDTGSAMFVPVQLTFITENSGFRQIVITNVYDFVTSEPDIASNVDLNACFLEQPRNSITFSISRMFQSVLEYFEVRFKYAVRSSIAQSINVSPLRVANIAYTVEETTLDITLDLLPLPNAHSDIVDPEKELSLDEATKRFEDAVKGSRLVIELNDDSDQPVYMVADPSSFQIQSINQRAVVTGFNPLVLPTTTISQAEVCRLYANPNSDSGYSVGAMVGTVISMIVVGGGLGGLTHFLLARTAALRPSER